MHRADRIRSLSNLLKESPHHEEDHRRCCCCRILVRRFRPSPRCNASHARDADCRSRDACCACIGCQGQAQAQEACCQGPGCCEACFVLIGFGQRKPGFGRVFRWQVQLTTQRLGPVDRGVNGAPPSRRGSGRGPAGRATGAAARAPCGALPSRAGARGAWPPLPEPDRAGVALP